MHPENRTLFSEKPWLPWLLFLRPRSRRRLLRPIASLTVDWWKRERERERAICRIVVSGLHRNMRSVYNCCLCVQADLSSSSSESESGDRDGQGCGSLYPFHCHSGDLRDDDAGGDDISCKGIHGSMNGNDADSASLQCVLCNNYSNEAAVFSPTRRALGFLQFRRDIGQG